MLSFRKEWAQEYRRRWLTEEDSLPSEHHMDMSLHLILVKNYAGVVKTVSLSIKVQYQH